jgi:hypothetical protein
MRHRNVIVKTKQDRRICLWSSFFAQSGLVFLHWSHPSSRYISVAKFFLQFALPISIMADTAKNQASSGLSKPMLGLFSPKTLEDSSTIRKHLVAADGEFIGTFLFLFGNYSLPTTLLSITTCSCGLNLTDADFHFTVCLSLVTLPIIEHCEFVH